MRIETDFEHDAEDSGFNYIDKSIKIILEGDRDIVKDIYKLIINECNKQNFEEV